MRRLQILRGQIQYKPELKDGEFFLDKTNHSLLIGDAAVADGQFELAKVSAITNLQQQVDTKITNPSIKSDGQVLTYESSSSSWIAKTFDIANKADIDLENVVLSSSPWRRSTETNMLSSSSGITYRSGSNFIIINNSGYFYGTAAYFNEISQTEYEPNTSSWRTGTWDSSFGFSSYGTYQIFGNSTNDVYVSCDNVLVKSTDGGASWTKIGTLPYSSIKFARYHNLESNQTLCLYNFKIYKFVISDEDGTYSIVELENAPTNNAAYIYYDINTNGYYITSNDGNVYFTSDVGQSWTTKGTLPSDVGSKAVVFCGTGQYGSLRYAYGPVSGVPYTSKLYVTTDDFATFESVDITDARILVSQENGFYIECFAGDSCHFVASKNSGDQSYIISFDISQSSTGAKIPYSNDIQLATDGEYSTPTIYSVVGNDYYGALYAIGSIYDTGNTNKIFDYTKKDDLFTTKELNIVNQLSTAGIALKSDIPTVPNRTSQLTNDSGFITSAQAPVQSVDGATGAVTTNAVKYTEQTLTDDQKTQARTNIGAGTSSFSGSYDDLSNKPTIPSKTSELDNDSNYITSAGAPVQSVNSKTGAVTLAASDVGAVPTTRTVNGKALSADITLSASDVGALPSTTVIPTYTLTKDETSADYAAVYHLNNGTEDVGVPINIPKDLFVESGEIVDNPTGQPEGKYIKLVLQNQTDPIYINVADLVDAYTAGNGITISDKNVISAAVTSVNGSTGAVTITVPTKVTDLTDAADYATVTSVNAVADDVEMLNSEVGTLTTDVDTLKTNITSKQNIITGGASTITDDNLTVSRALVSDSSGKVAVSDITATELDYLSGATGNIQTQIDGLNDSVLLNNVEGSEITLPGAYQWRDIAYNGSVYVAVASSTDKGAYSRDGINWTEMTMPSSTNWGSIIYGNNKFVALSWSHVIAYSDNGIDWSTATLPSEGSNDALYGIAYGNGKFVVVNYNSDNAMYSEDGITWTMTTMPAYNSWYDVVYGNGKFVAVGHSSNNAAYSVDGITWTATTLPYSGDWYLGYGNNTFVAILGSMNSTHAAYSIDGVTWTASTLPTPSNAGSDRVYWTRICYGKEKFIVICNIGVLGTKSAVTYSKNGIDWSEAVELPGNGNGWSKVTYSDKFFAAGYQSNKIFISEDGITWTNKSPNSYTLNSTTGTDITSSVYSALEPYIPTPTVPTKTSELTNDSGYITQTDGDGRYLQLSGGTVNGKVNFVDTATNRTASIGAEEGTPLSIAGEKDNAGYRFGMSIFSKGMELAYSGGSSINFFSTGNDGIEIATTTKNIRILAGSGSVKIYDVATPTSDDMATPKSYVDQYAPHATLVTLTVAGWDSTAKTQTVTVSGILADESKQLIIPMPAAASMTAYNDAGIQCTGQAANSLTFTATTVPTAAISVYVTYQAVIS